VRILQSSNSKLDDGLKKGISLSINLKLEGTNWGVDFKFLLLKEIPYLVRK
jgi:hypothetical protein